MEKSVRSDNGRRTKADIKRNVYSDSICLCDSCYFSSFDSLPQGYKRGIRTVKNVARLMAITEP